MMRRAGILGCSLAIIAAALLPSRAIRAEQYSRGGTFMLPGWDAKGAALGGATLVLARDERAAYWNPANLTFLASSRLSVGTMELVPGLDNRYSILCAGVSFSEVRPGPARAEPDLGELSPDSAGAPGRGWVSDDPLPWRRAAIAISASHLGIDLARGSKWNESTIGLSGAFAPRAGTSLGITIRGMKSWTDVADADSWGISFDIGITERFADHAWIAATGKNIVGLVSYPERVDTLDATWCIALAYRDLFDRISVECDGVIRYGVIDRLLAGVELVLAPNVLSILGGVDVRMTGGERVIPSIGVATTFRFAEIALASSFDPVGAFGRQTRVTASLIFP